MDHDTQHNITQPATYTNRTDNRTDNRSGLPDSEDWRHIGRLHGSDLKVADGDLDVNGWSVRSKDGRIIGTVTDLLVNTRLMMVEFIEVATAKDPSHHIILPIKSAVLDDDVDEVQFLGAFDEFSEMAIGAPSTVDSELSAETTRFFGQRRSGREQDPYFVSPGDTSL